MKSSRISGISAALVVAIVLFTSNSALRATPSDHVTDGHFTSPSEWSGPSVSKNFFPVQGQSGGAYLYVEQGIAPASGVTPSALALPNTLFLMYDWVNSPNVAPLTNSSFVDVFFQVNGGSDPANYLVRISPTSANSFQAFERPQNSTPPLNPDGSFNIGAGSGWSALNSSDLALAKFSSAVSLDSSPDFATPHWVIEFQLSFTNPQAPNNPGLYDPSPAFWSASAEPGGSPAARGDPPISSGIFTLNPDGTTTVVPQFDANGAPAKLPNQVPEPASYILVGVGLLTLLAKRARSCG